MSFKKNAFVSNKRIIASALGCMAISCPLLLAACGDDGIVDSLTVGEGKLKDERDGQEYKTMTIRSQTWMTENLN